MHLIRFGLFLLIVLMYLRTNLKHEIEFFFETIILSKKEKTNKYPTNYIYLTQDLSSVIIVLQKEKKNIKIYQSNKKERKKVVLFICSLLNIFCCIIFIGIFF